MLDDLFPDGLDRSWMAEAACAGYDVRFHFPDMQARAAVGREDADVQAEYARRVCTGCPVEAECLDYSINSESLWGVWGGRTEEERRALIEIRRVFLGLPLPLYVPGVTPAVAAPPDPVVLAREAAAAEADWQDQEAA